MNVYLILLSQLALLIIGSGALRCFECEFLLDKNGNAVDLDGKPIGENEDDYLCFKEDPSQIWPQPGYNVTSKYVHCEEFTAFYYERNLKFTERTFYNSDAYFDDSLIGTCINLPDVDDLTNRKKCYCNKDLCNVNLNYNSSRRPFNQGFCWLKLIIAAIGIVSLV